MGKHYIMPLCVKVFQSSIYLENNGYVSYIGLVSEVDKDIKLSFINYAPPYYLRWG